MTSVPWQQGFAIGFFAGLCYGLMLGALAMLCRRKP